MRLSETKLTVLHDGEFDDLGLLGTAGLGYLVDKKYATKVRGPIITTREIAESVDDLRARGVIVADDPESTFWELHRRLLKDGFYPNAGKIEQGVGCDIHPSAVLGKDGFEIHDARLIPHAGWVRIGDRVTIGAQTCVDRSVWKEPTFIDDDSHIDNLVHVAHNVRIGKRCMVVAGTVIGGSTVLEDDVFLGIGVRLRPGVRVGAGAFIGMSVTVLDDVPAGARITARS